MLLVGVVGSAAGLLLWEGGPTRHDITYVGHTSEAAMGEASRTGPGDLEFTGDVRQQNLTLVLVHVEAEIQGARPTASEAQVILNTPNGTFEGTIPLPEGTDAASGTLTIEVPLGATPQDQSVRATDAADALRHAAPADDAGVGEYSVTVTFGGAFPLAPLDQNTRTAKITLELHGYHAEAQRHIPAGPEAR